MEIKNKHVFWEALILALFIFASGIFLGYLMELNRTSKIITLYQESELNIFDARLQADMIDMANFSCEKALKEIFNFADRTYQEARLLDKYEGANKLSSGITIQHKKYDLLRTMLWLNSLQLNNKCKKQFVNVVYFYEYMPKDIVIKSEQDVFSNKLSEMKEKFDDKILLIPIAGNLDVNSINYLKSFYNISTLPAVLIDEKHKIDSMEKLAELEKYINTSFK